MLEILYKISESPAFVIILSVASALLGVWGKNRAVLRRLRNVEDEIDHLADRFDRANKIRGGRASADKREEFMREAQEIAARAQTNQTIKLPGRVA